MKRLILTFAAAVLTAARLSAHPGHGHGDGTSVVHHATSPEHNLFWLLVLVPVGAVVAGLLIRARRKSH